MAVIWMNTMKNMLVHYFIQNLRHWTWNMVLRLVPIIAYFILWSETENPLTKISSKLPSFWPGGSTSNIRLAGWDENHDKDVKQCLRFKLNFSWFLFVSFSRRLKSPAALSRSFVSVSRQKWTFQNWRTGLLFFGTTGFHHNSGNERGLRLDLGIVALVHFAPSFLQVS